MPRKDNAAQKQRLQAAIAHLKNMYKTEVGANTFLEGARFRVFQCVSEICRADSCWGPPSRDCEGAFGDLSDWRSLSPFLHNRSRIPAG